LILRKISEFDATRCQILRLKYTKFDFLFKGPTSKGREGEDGVGRGREGKGREGKGRGGERNVGERPGLPNILA